jgi:hypothetical protein
MWVGCVCLFSICVLGFGTMDGLRAGGVMGYVVGACAVHGFRLGWV